MVHPKCLINGSFILYLPPGFAEPGGTQTPVLMSHSSIPGHEAHSAWDVQAGGQGRTSPTKEGRGEAYTKIVENPFFYPTRWRLR